MPVPGRGVSILVDDTDLSTYLNEFKFERKGDSIDVSHFGSKVRSYLSGPQETTVTLNGFFDGGQDQVDDVFHSKFGAAGNINVTICPDTSDYGKPCYLIPTTQITYDIKTKVEDAVEIEAQFRANGSVNRGIILVDDVLRVASGSATSIDNGTAAGATAFGGTAHLHAYSVTGTTKSLDVIVEHSTDNSTWATLMTFANLTGSGTQRIETIKTLTVNQYVRGRWVLPGTGSPSAVFSLAFSRGTAND